MCKTEFPNWALSHFLKCSTCCPMLLPSCFQKVSVHGSCKNSFQIEPHSIFSIAGRAAPFLFLKIQIYRFCSTKFHTWHLLIFYHDAWCAAPFLFLKTSVYSVLLKNSFIHDIPSYFIMVHGVLPPSCFPNKSLWFSNELVFKIGALSYYSPRVQKLFRKNVKASFLSFWNYLAAECWMLQLCVTFNTTHFLINVFQLAFVHQLSSQSRIN